MIWDLGEGLLPFRVVTPDELPTLVIQTPKQAAGLCSHPHCQEPAVLIRVVGESRHAKCWRHAVACGMAPQLIELLREMTEQPRRDRPNLTSTNT